MKKLLIKLCFEQSNTGSGVAFMKLYRELLDRSDDLDPEPVDIDAKYGQHLGLYGCSNYPYTVLTLTYQISADSRFKIKKKALATINKICSEIDGPAINLIETE